LIRDPRKPAAHSAVRTIRIRLCRSPSFC
jgi:hypothetical protein